MSPSTGIEREQRALRSAGGIPSRPEFGMGELRISCWDRRIRDRAVRDRRVRDRRRADRGVRDRAVGIGENANEPSSAGGTELTGTFAAPGGTDGSSEVRPRPASVSAVVTETHAENSEVLPFASVAVAVIDWSLFSPTTPGPVSVAEKAAARRRASPHGCRGTSRLRRCCRVTARGREELDRVRGVRLRAEPVCHVERRAVRRRTGQHREVLQVVRARVGVKDVVRSDATCGPRSIPRPWFP